MKYSISQVLILIFILTALIGTVLIFGVSFYFYQFSFDQTIEEKKHTLEILAEALAGPLLTFREPLHPLTIESILSKTIELPGILFIRSFDEENKIIIFSSDPTEKGMKTENPPSFLRTVTVRDVLFKGESIKEFSIKARDGTNLWLGLSLRDIKRNILLATLFLGTVIIIIVVIMALLIFFLIRRFFIIPFFFLAEAFEKLRKGDYQTRLPGFPLREVQEVFQYFNKTAKELGSHKILEEAKMILELKVKARTKELRELTEGQEEIIKERTKELQNRLTELERFHRLAVGRELKMVELKKEIGKLEKQIGKLKKK